MKREKQLPIKSNNICTSMERDMIVTTNNRYEWQLLMVIILKGKF